jgi:hypothetical protein
VILGTFMIIVHYKTRCHATQRLCDILLRFYGQCDYGEPVMKNVDQ